MPDTPYLLASADEIRTIFRRSLAVLDALLERDDDDEDEDQESYYVERSRLRSVIEALRFCCVAAGQLGDPSLVPLIEEALEARERFDDHPGNDVPTMAGALTWLLRAGAPAGPEMQRLARHDDARVREAVAAGLQPRGDREIALLDALSTDPIPGVRNTARVALSAVREVAWWKGKLSADPIARLAPEEALALKPTFERLSALLDQPSYVVLKRDAELVELAGALPDPLLVDLVETVHAAEDPYGTTFPALITLVLPRPGGLDALKKICAVWARDRARYRDGKRIAGIVTSLPAADRARVCRELAVHAVAFSDKERAMQSDSAARLVAELVGATWPPGEDLTPLLDALLSLPAEPPHKIDWVRAGLENALSAEGADPTPVLDRLIEARLAGYPGSWRAIGRHADVLLQRAPAPTLRLVAERAALGDDPRTVQWGIEQLLGRARDPERDGPLADFIDRLLAEPRHRAAILASSALLQRALPALRLELRAGRLDFTAATTLIEFLGVLYGGVAAPLYSSRIRAAEEIESARRGARAPLEAFLGPEALRGPPTDEEWAELRAAHARRLAEGDPERKHVFRPMPEGPWSPEDRGVLEEALAVVRAGDRDLIFHVGLALSAKPAEADLPILDELLRLASPDDRSLMRYLKPAVRSLLGLPPAAPAAAAPASAGAAEEPETEGEWMDEEDDEDDDG